MVLHKMTIAQVTELADSIAELYALLRPTYDEDLTHQSVRVLQYIAMAVEPPRVDDVRKFLGGAAASASEFVKRLAARGLVARQRSSQDERVVELVLTKKGALVLRQHTHLDIKKLEAAFRDTPEVSVETMVKMLGHLLNAARRISPGIGASELHVTEGEIADPNRDTARGARQTKAKNATDPQATVRRKQTGRA